MKRLDVFATEEETKKIVELYEEAQSTPVIAMTSAHALRGGFSADAWDRVYKEIDRVAQVHGLPKPGYHYGFDPTTRAFMSE